MWGHVGCTHQQHVASTAWGTHIEILVAATVYEVSLFIAVCVHSSVSNVAPRTLGVLQASTPKAEVFQVSNGSSLSRRRFLRQINNVIIIVYESIVALDGGLAKAYWGEPEHR